MKKITTLFVLLVLVYNVHAQNVGVGTKTPLANLEVQGNLLVQQQLLLTNSLPTIAQNYTMVNGSTSNTNVADSIGRIYDPSGTGNYIPNLQSAITVQNNTATGIQITIEDIDLNTGDSLIIVNTSTGTRLLAVGNIYSSLATYNFNNTTGIQLLFKSNIDANVGRGFQIAYKFIFFATSAPRIDNGNGKHLYYNPQTGLRLVTGAEGKGKFLTSDSIGNTNWKTFEKNDFLTDVDSNTTIKVERTPNDNIIRLTTDGIDHTWFQKNNTGAYPLINYPVNGTANFLLGTQSGWNLKPNTVGNTFIGIKTGFTDSTGNYNSFIGDSTGLFATGSRNVGLGARASYLLGNGNDNVNIGMNAGRGAIRTNNVIHIGSSSGLYDSVTNRNIAIGSGALLKNNGDANIAIGSGALANNVMDTNYILIGGQIAIGDSVLYNNTGNQNTAMGNRALYNNTTGSRNTANGYNSLTENITGINNTANGYISLVANTTGSYNTANGVLALVANRTGSYNTANGALALKEIDDGSFNTALGYNAQIAPTPFFGTPITNATAIGANAVVGASNCIVLGSTNSSINVGIGTTTPTVSLEVQGGIKTKYSGSTVVSVVGGTSFVNLTIPAVPTGWDFTNTMVTVTNVDGQSGTIYQTKLTSLTNIQVYFTSNSVSTNAARFNYIIFKL